MDEGSAAANGWGDADDPADAAILDLPAADDVTGDAAARAWRGFASVIALLVAGLLVALILLVAHSNSARDAALARERHSYEVMLVTAKLGATMNAAEAALGHYVVNGDRTVGSAVSDRWALAGTMLDRLDHITLDNPDQHALVDRLRRLYLARGRELGDTALRAYYHQGWPALTLFDKAGKSATGPLVQRLLRQLADNERALLDTRATQAADSVAHSNRMAAWLSGIGIVMVLGAALMGATAFQATAERHIARRNLKRETERAATLEARVAERTAELKQANEALKAEAAERHAAEAQLHQVQKMEAVGQLTGGIAHDFNNMLAVVVGGLDLARRRLTEETDEVGRHIENAMEGANRAAALTRRLLAFARAEPLLPDAVEPQHLLTGMLDLLDRTLGEPIKVIPRLAPDLWPVWADPHQLENAILNLAVNARDAMPDGGTLTVDAHNERLSSAIGEARPGDYVCIRVTDTGVGMSKAVLDRVFEPFFTTKPVGKGTGLGLSQLFGFARQSGGEVRIRSAEGSGTSVSLYLPRHDGLARVARRTDTVVPASPPAARGRGEAVLVVEDDPRVRRSTEGALEELGYAPLACETGDAALALLARRPDVRLMVTDVVMPGMTGPELVRRVVATRPDLGILFVTGYVGDAGDAGDLQGHEILRKPFTVAALGGAMAAVVSRISVPNPASAGAGGG